MPRYSKKELQEARAELHRLLDPLLMVQPDADVRSPSALSRRAMKGPTILLRLDSVSRSGMTRRIIPMLLLGCEGGDPDIRYLGRLAGIVLGWGADDHAVRVSGCGMDMGFHLVYSLSLSLWHEQYGSQAGYFLSHRWI